MRWLLLVCVSAIAGFETPCPAGEIDYRKSPGFSAYQQANSAFAARDFQRSSDLIDQALDLDRKLLPALTLKAKLAMATGKPGVAREALLEAVRVAPNSEYAHFLLGFQYYIQNEMRAALDELEKARRLNAKDASPLLYLGLTHETLGDAERAVGFYRQAISVEEASGTLQSETLLTLERLLLLTGRLKECGTLLDRAIKLEPNSRDAYYELARLLLKSGDPSSAARAGEKALRLPPGGIPERQIRYLLVRAHGLAGDERRAGEHAKALRDESEEKLSR